MHRDSALLRCVGMAGITEPRTPIYLQLREIIKNTLRKGDVFSRYSRNQYVLMLSVRQPGDSGVVAERLLKGWKASGLSSSMRIDISTGLPEPIV